LEEREETTTIDAPKDAAAAERDIRHTIQLLAEGWNQKAARLFSSAFTDPHDYVAINGFQLLGQSRDANAAMH